MSWPGGIRRAVAGLLGRKANGSLAFDKLFLSATSGKAEAQYQLGLAYARGHETMHYPSVGLKWLSRAAEQGHAEAQHMVSLLYLNGARARGPAAAWMAEIASLSSQRNTLPPNANAVLLYPEGLDVQADASKAFAWAKAAAFQGLAVAQSNLGMLYLRGVGCERDFAEAARLSSA